MSWVKVKWCSYQKYNFDIDLYESLRDNIAEIEDDLLNPEWSILKEVQPQIPDILKQIHLKPNELIEKYSLDLINEIDAKIHSKN